MTPERFALTLILAWLIWHVVGWALGIMIDVVALTVTVAVFLALVVVDLAKRCRPRRSLLAPGPHPWDRKP